jgi:heme A synthase
MRTFLKSQRHFTTYAWLVLGFTILVILWGAFVRATGSGAGCGSHWPLCNGVVVPREPAVETQIELFHRVTSALSGVFVLGLLAWSFYAFPKGHIVRKGAVLSTFFIITEGLVGAGLVLFELVAHNASVARVYSMAAHLVNTFLLLGALTLTAWWAGGGRPFRLRGQGKTGWLLLGGLGFLLLLGVSGAVTALGDTLFPAGSLSEGIAQDFEATAHFLVRLRIYHPIIAIITGIYLVIASSIIHEEKKDPQTHRFSRILRVLFLIQLGAGFVNVILLAPVWMQIIHLLLADLIWIAAILFGAAALSAPVPVTESESSPAMVAPAGD